MLPKVEVPGTGRSVGRVGLGCMLFSVEGRPSRDDATAVVRRALECGVDLFDTANVYALDEVDMGHNERLLADALKSLGRSTDPTDTESPLVATKGGMIRRGVEWLVDGRPEQIRSSCEESLRALRTECIGLYQLHAPDPRVPFADSVGAIARLQEEGKVAAVGISNVSAGQIREAAGVVRIATVQNGYGPWAASRVVPPSIRAAEDSGALFLAHSPFGGRDRAGSFTRLPFLKEAAERLEFTPHEVALAWLLAESQSVVPLPGARRPESVESSARAVRLLLDSPTRSALSQGFRAAFTESSFTGMLAGRLRGALGRLR